MNPLINFRAHKILRNASVASHLAASQEILMYMELVIFLSKQQYIRQVQFAVYDDFFRHIFAIFISSFLLKLFYQAFSVNFPCKPSKSTTICMYIIYSIYCVVYTVYILYILNYIYIFISITSISYITFILYTLYSVKHTGGSTWF
jgi:hypothetical protein